MKTRATTTLVGFALALLLQSSAAADEARMLSRYRASAQDFASGRAALQRGDLGAAERSFNRAVRADGNFVEAMVELARLHLDRDDGDAALQWLERAEKVGPSYPRIAATRGLIALRDRNFEDAHEHFDTAHRDAPEDIEIGVNLGAVLIARQSYGEAQRVLGELVELAPSNADLAFNLALAKDLAGQSDAAAYDSRRFLALSNFSDPERGAVEARLSELSKDSAEADEPEEVSLASQAQTNQGEE